MNELLLCAACKRHVLESETACPFCASSDLTRPERRPASKLAARVALSSAVLAMSGVGASACTNVTTDYGSPGYYDVDAGNHADFDDAGGDANAPSEGGAGPSDANDAG